MTQTLTPGRWLGLRSTSSDQDIFNIIAFDQRGSYRRMLPDNTSYEDAVQIKIEVVGALTRVASAILLDPTYGLSPAMHRGRGSGLVLALEKSGYSGDSTYRGVEFDAQWNLDKLKKMGATAVKLLVYYHPDTGELAEKNEQLIREVAENCHAHDLPLFLEPMSYSIDADISKNSEAFAKTRPEVVIETARRLSKTGVDVLKMEFPHDAAFESDESVWRKGCEDMSGVSDVPWVLLSAGVDFEVFERQTLIACESGASGWLAGRAIWKEAVEMTPAQRADFLGGQASERTQKLIDIANSAARPWTDFYQPLTGNGEWYHTY